MKYKNLFIDFDDTLYDTRGNADIALIELYEHFDLSQHFDSLKQFTDAFWETNVQLWGQYARGEIEREYLVVERMRRPLSVGLGERATEAYCLKVSDWYLDCCADKPGVIDGAHELMDHLKRKGYRLHMCSNGFHEVQYRKLKASRLHDYFDTVILSEDAGANKPSPHFFHYALNRSGAQIADTLMIGDNFSTDIMGAKSVGIDTMYFNARLEDFAASSPVTYEIHHLREAMDIL